MLVKNKKIDFVLLGFLLLFLGISLITIESASTYLPSYLGNLPLKQLIFYGIGFILMFLIWKIGYESLCNLAYPFYILSVIALVLLFPFGTTVNSSTCWFQIPGIGSIQPSEFMKVALILVLSKETIKFRQKKEISWLEEVKYLGKILTLVLIPSVLTFLEPDTGAVLIYLIITLFMIFLSGLRLRWFILGGTIAILGIGSFFYLYFGERETFINLFGTQLFYRIERLLSWQKGDSYQLENALAAVGSAGLLGHGFNKTPLYFPESGTDFIFAVFASNFGYLGSLALILLLFLFDSYLLYIAFKNKDTLAFYLIIGTFSILLYQQIQNIGMTLGMLPITGITLPFISYGGSSLLSYFLLIGIVLSIRKEKDKRITSFKTKKT